MTTSATEFPQQPRQWTASTDTRLNWLLDELVTRVPHLQKATILSRDGLALGSSAGLSREDAEHLAALAAGISSLSNGGSEYFGTGRVQQTVIEADGGFLFVTAAGEGSCLAVLAAPEADVGLIAYEMAVLVKRVGRHMGVGKRPAEDGE
jgi:predicted regulator of Ras-like GTPase activity (Roadblock/LC7/MglB family)